MTTSYSQDIQAGDIVTWRDGGRPKPDARFEPIGFVGCEVKELQAIDGESFALLELPRYGQTALVHIDNIYKD